MSLDLKQGVLVFNVFLALLLEIVVRACLAEVPHSLDTLSIFTLVTRDFVLNQMLVFNLFLASDGDQKIVDFGFNKT